MDWRDIKGMGRVGLNDFSPGDVAAMTGLSTDLQRVWRRRGHLPARSESRASFDARDVAAIAVRHELARMGFSPPDTVEIGIKAAPLVLFYALLSGDGAADLRGGLKRLAEIAERFAQDEKVAKSISGVDHPYRYLWSSSPPMIEFVDDACAMLSADRFSAMLVLDLAVIGHQLVANSPKALFTIEVPS